MNHDSTKAVYEETTLAARLLDEFSELSRKTRRNKTRSKATAAASAFFDKDYLTIADFFSPIGHDLRMVPQAEMPPATVDELISTLRRHEELWNKASRTGEASAMINESFRRRKLKKTIKKFLEKIGT